MAIGNVKAKDELNLGDQPGLEYESYPNAKGPQSVKCSECDADLMFNPDELLWTFQRPFEFVEVQCSNCGGDIELTAADTGSSYDYFTGVA